MKKEDIYSITNAEVTSNNQFLQIPPNPYYYRGSDALSFTESRQSLQAGLIENNTSNIQSCLGEIGSLIVIEPNKYQDQYVFATCSSSISEKTIKFWDTQTMKMIFEIPKKGFGSILQMTYCKISKTFGTITFDRKISIYSFNPQSNSMKFKFQFQLNNSPSHIEIYKNNLFVGSSKKQQILWINMKKKKVLRTFYLKEQLIKFCFVPKLKCLATNNEGCSLIQLCDGSIKHIYFTYQHSRKSPFKRYFKQNSQGFGSISEMISSNKHSQTYLSSATTIESPIQQEQQIEKVKLVHPFLQRNGIGNEGDNQLCQLVKYNRQLNCIIFVFFDYILLYNVANQRIYQVIKDLMPIENVQYSFFHDLLIVQCSERENGQLSYYLSFSRDQNHGNDSPLLNQQTQFCRISCQLFQKSKNFYITDYFLIMDSLEKEMKGSVVRRRITFKNKGSIFPSISQSSNLNSSNQISRNPSNKKMNAFSFDDMVQLQIKVLKLEQIEEQDNNLNAPIEEKKEKLCRCIIF